MRVIKGGIGIVCFSAPLILTLCLLKLNAMYQGVYFLDTSVADIIAIGLLICLGIIFLRAYSFIIFSRNKTIKIYSYIVIAGTLVSLLIDFLLPLRRY